jgi:hypothetical protein
MTNYNDGKWHKWEAGSCPVHPESIVSVLFAWNKDEIVSGEKARAWYWGDATLVAFRVVKEYKEPREWWVNVYPTSSGILHDTEESAKKVSGVGAIGTIKVREVIE